jgi:diguanylate cyclase (GGDEF)-like protein
MRQDELLLTVLGIAILLNVLLVVASWLGSRRRRSSRASAAQAPPSELVGVPVALLTPAGREDDGRVAAAVEAFVASVSPDAAGSGRVPTPDEVLARREEALRSALASMPPVHLPSARSGPAYRAADADTNSGGPPPARPSGVADAATWEEIVRDESARAARFRRASTVMTASLPHLEEVAERWGREAADRVVAEITRLLESEGRAVDRRAWLGEGKFGILLPETGADGASRYAERVRAAADAWLVSAGLSVRLDLEWATVPNGAGVDAPTPVTRPRKRPATRPR